MTQSPPPETGPRATGPQETAAPRTGPGGARSGGLRFTLTQPDPAQPDPAPPLPGRMREAPRAPVRDESLDLGAFLGVLARGKGLIALVTALAVLAGGYYAYVIAVPVYRSTATVILDTREAQIAAMDSGAGGLTGDSATVNSEVEVLRSRALLGKVVDRLDLTQDPEFNGALRPPGLRAWLRAGLRGFFDAVAGLTGQRGGAPPSPAAAVDPQAAAAYARTDAVGALLARLSIRNIPQTLVFEVTIASEEPQKAARIADTLVELYVRNQIEVKFEATEQATAWLTDRVAALQTALQAAEARVKAFSAGSDMISAETLVAQERQLKDLREQIDSTARAGATAAAYLARLDAAGTPAAQAEAAEDPQLRRLLPLLDQPGNRAVFDTRFAQIRTRTALEADRAATQRQALAETATALEAQIARQGSDLIALQQLTREAEANRLLYEDFLGRLKETSARQGIQQADSRILSPAAVPGAPSAPRKSRILALAGLIGLLAGAGLVLLREARATGFRTARALEEFAGRRVLGQIPLLPPRGRHRSVAWLRDRPTSAVAEAVRNLRTSILLAQGARPPQVIVVTSALPGEGKTTLALALAQSFAGLNRRVLLIEGDIRHRGMQPFLGGAARPGLMAVLSGTATLEAAAGHEADLGADVLLGEASAASPADVFATPEFARLIAGARQRYDTILIDTPPVLAVPDARVIAPLADATLVVVRWDSTPRADLEEALDLYDSAGQPVHGLVLTRIDPQRMRRPGQAGRYAPATRSRGPYAG